jgi:hypothetical protein
LEFPPFLRKLIGPADHFHVFEFAVLPLTGCLPGSSAQLAESSMSVRFNEIWQEGLS